MMHGRKNIKVLRSKYIVHLLVKIEKTLTVTVMLQ